MEIEDDYSQEPPSKTSRKKEMHALQAIGARLTGFSDSLLDQLPLSAQLRNAIREYNRLPNSHGARRRQLQFIGRLMRDYQLDEIESAIDKIQHPQRNSTANRKKLESWCEQVLAGGDEGINQLLQKFEQLDRQTLRRLHLDYQKASGKGQDTELERIRKKLTGYLRKEIL